MSMNNLGQPYTSSYDDVPYLGRSYSQTHPDNLATIATLFGLSPSPVQSCRVLELGCARGFNLIPMAVGLPQSEFVGIDSSGVQIRDGQDAIKELGLKNISLKQMNIMDVNAGLGTFDYIIAHGIFSWVPEPVREKMMTICCDNMSPNGVAYISYNTYPGWHLLRAVRDMMLYHTRNVAEPRTRIAQARAFIDFVADSATRMSQVSNEFLDKAYAFLLQHEKNHLGSSTDSYLFHEELEESNEPVQFSQFAGLAARHGLQYLSEASLYDVFLSSVPLQIREKLLEVSDDLIELEQNTDFLVNRVFRRTLLVHQDLPVSRTICPERVYDLYIGSNCSPVSAEPEIRSDSVEEFKNFNEVKLATNHPVTKAAMLSLSDIWPKTVSFDGLMEKAYQHLSSVSSSGETHRTISPEDRQQDATVLGSNLLRGFLIKSPLVELHYYQPDFSMELSERPLASPWARYQSRIEVDLRAASAYELKGRPIAITNLRHELIQMAELTLCVLSHLDGTLDRKALLERLTSLVDSGDLVLHSLSTEKKSEAQDNKSASAIDAGMAKQRLEQGLEPALYTLARGAFLLA
jgi:methyltransferase-like protein/2-polyprenyl-3-methyl-5-hydroxy-6-metoxy-1,4-benzoquinol methylase